MSYERKTNSQFMIEREQRPSNKLQVGIENTSKVDAQFLITPKPTRKQNLKSPP